MLSKVVAGALMAFTLVVGATARADDSPAGGEIGEREIGVGVGLAAGGTYTPGGVRVSGRFLYQLADDDWFDGAAAFTYGGGGSGCIAEPNGGLRCVHGRLDGLAVQITGGFRRRFTGNGKFVPHIRVATGMRVMRYSADDLGGIAIPLIAAGGVRVRVSPGIAVGAEAAVEVGVGWFGHGVGAVPQAGLVIGGQVEFVLR